jgi:hypothetical protein
VPPTLSRTLKRPQDTEAPRDESLYRRVGKALGIRSTHLRRFLSRLAGSNDCPALMGSDENAESSPVLSQCLVHPLVLTRGEAMFYAKVSSVMSFRRRADRKRPHLIAAVRGAHCSSALANSRGRTCTDLNSVCYNSITE